MKLMGLLLVACLAKGAFAQCTVCGTGATACTAADVHTECLTGWWLNTATNTCTECDTVANKAGTATITCASATTSQLVGHSTTATLKCAVGYFFTAGTADICTACTAIATICSAGQGLGGGTTANAAAAINGICLGSTTTIPLVGSCATCDNAASAATDGSCTACGTGALTCTSTTVHLTCADGYYLDSDGTVCVTCGVPATVVSNIHSAATVTCSNGAAAVDLRIVPATVTPTLYCAPGNFYAAGAAGAHDACTPCTATCTAPNGLTGAGLAAGATAALAAFCDGSTTAQVASTDCTACPNTASSLTDGSCTQCTRGALTTTCSAAAVDTHCADGSWLSTSTTTCTACSHSTNHYKLCAAATPATKCEIGHFIDTNDCTACAVACPASAGLKDKYTVADWGTTAANSNELMSCDGTGTAQITAGTVATGAIAPGTGCLHCAAGALTCNAGAARATDGAPPNTALTCDPATHVQVWAECSTLSTTGVDSTGLGFFPTTAGNKSNRLSTCVPKCTASDGSIVDSEAYCMCGGGGTATDATDAQVVCVLANAMACTANAVTGDGTCGVVPVESAASSASAAAAAALLAAGVAVFA